MVQYLTTQQGMHSLVRFSVIAVGCSWVGVTWFTLSAFLKKLGHSMWERHCCKTTSRAQTNMPLQQSLVIVEGTVEMSDVLPFAGAVCGVHGHGASDTNWWKCTSDTFRVCCFSRVHACTHQSPHEENMQPCMSKAKASWRGCKEAGEDAKPQLKVCLRGNTPMTATEELCEQRLASALTALQCQAAAVWACGLNTNINPFPPPQWKMYISQHGMHYGYNKHLRGLERGGQIGHFLQQSE